MASVSSAAGRRGRPCASGSRSKGSVPGYWATRSSMLAIRLSCRSSTPSCLRTSRLAAVGWLGKSLGAARIVAGLTGGGRPAGGRPGRNQEPRGADGGRVAARLGHQVAQGADVDGGLDRGGGHLARVGLAVDHRERLDLDDVEGPVEPERDQVGLQVGGGGGGALGGQ